MRIAVLAAAGAWNASTRYRALQHVPRLRSLFAEVEVFLPHDDVNRGRGPLGRAGFFSRHAVRYLRRARQVGRVLPRFDAVLVQTGLYGMGPGWVTRPLERFHGVVVYDLDDAIFEVSPGLAVKGRAARALYGPQQALRLLKRADAVIVSTDELANLLPDGARLAAVLPTVPDVQRYPIAEHRPGLPITVGWVGTAGNLPCLDPLAPVFRRLADERVARVEVVSSEPWSGPAGFSRWTLAEESVVFSRFAVGIMPLPDMPYTRAKAGFKLLQSMAAAVPVVASPVGVNRRLIEDSGAGLIASTTNEWEAALRRLAHDAALRRALGERGRRFVGRYADLEHQATTLAALLGAPVGR